MGHLFKPASLLNENVTTVEVGALLLVLYISGRVFPRDPGPAHAVFLLKGSFSEWAAQILKNTRKDVALLNHLQSSLG